MELKGYVAVGEGRAILLCQTGSWASCLQALSPRDLGETPAPYPTLGWPLSAGGGPGRGPVFPNSGAPNGGALLLVILVLEARRPRVYSVLGSWLCPHQVQPA